MWSRIFCCYEQNWGCVCFSAKSPLTFWGYSWTIQNVISPRAGAMPLVTISHSITWIWTSRYGLSYILILACAVEVFVWWHSREARDSGSSTGNQAGLHQCSITSQACWWSSQHTCKSHPQYFLILCQNPSCQIIELWTNWGSIEAEG